jgi:hypothetical protein
VTLGRDPALPVAQLLAAADQALYRAKANGRNRVQSAEPELVETSAPSIAPVGHNDRRGWRRVAART